MKVELNFKFCTKWIIISFPISFSISKILRDAQTLSERMNHRGACACDNDTGDGAGVLASIPHGLYVKAL